MPYTTLEIYEKLVSGARIKVRLETKSKYDVLRTELCREHRVTRDLLGLSDKAICSSFKNSIGSFHIGVPSSGKTISLVVTHEAISQ